MEIDINVIKQLIDSLDKSSVDKLVINTSEFDLTLEKNNQPVFAGTASLQTVSMPAKTAEVSDIVIQAKGILVTAPIVGTYYASSSPEKPPFVTIGQRVKKGDTLFIIESMKLMNEVTSEYSGIVAEIMIESGKPVEYGQAVMRIE